MALEQPTRLELGSLRPRSAFDVAITSVCAGGQTIPTVSTFVRTVSDGGALSAVSRRLLEDYPNRSEQQYVRPGCRVLRRFAVRMFRRVSCFAPVPSRSVGKTGPI